MKILVLGTSHSGAIKLGLDKLLSEQFPTDQVQIDYACVGIKNFQDFACSYGQLSHPKAELVQKVGVQFPLKLGTYDKIIYVAGANPLNLKYYLSRRNYSSESNLLSRSVVKNIVYNVAGALRFNKNFYLLQNLKEKYVKKLFIVPHPLISEETKPEFIAQPISQNIIDMIRNVSNLSLTKADVPSIVLPPEKLLSSCQQYTKKIYNQGGANVKGIERHSDFMHMNGAYGEIYSKEILKALKIS